MFNKKFALIALILCIVLTVGYFAVNTEALSTVLLAIQGAITDGNLVKFSGTNGIGVDTGLSATNVVKCKFDATIAPTINNDVSEGYTVGSRWLDITNLKSYVCLDNTDGAAVWIENVVEGDMNKSTYDADEDGDIDVAAGGTEKSVWTQYAIPYLSDTTAFGEISIGTAGQVLKVSAGATGYEFADESDPTVDEDSELKAILVDEVTKTGDFTAGRMAKINNASGIIEQGTNTDTEVTDAVTKKHSQNADTDLDSTFEATFVKKVDTVNVLSDVTSPGANIEDAVTKKHSQNADTDLDTTFEATFVKKTDTVNVLSDITSPGANIEDAVTKKHTSGSETQGGDISGTVGNASVNKIKRGLDASKSATPAVGDIYLATDTDKLYKCITAEAWTLLKNLDLSGNNVADLADVTSAGADIEDAVTKKHAQNADTDLDTTFEATFVKKVDTVNVLSDITSAGANIEDAVTKKHSQNTDTTLIFTNALASDHTYSGELDSQPVGESVVFGQLLYYDWTDVEWKLAKADAFGTAKATRIALETKANGETCLMLVKGYIRDDSAFDFGAARVFLNDDTFGACDDTAPAESGDQIFVVGEAKSADILFFNPGQDVGEI